MCRIIGLCGMIGLCGIINLCRNLRAGKPRPYEMCEKLKIVRELAGEHRSSLSGEVSPLRNVWKI